METENKECEIVTKYAAHANHHLMEIHFGTLPHPDGWVVFSNQGRSDKVNRFIALLRGSHETAALSWNHEEGKTFAIMILEDEEPDDLGDLWDEACGIAV